MFLSSFESSVDVKKRVSIPAPFRKSLGGEDSALLHDGHRNARNSLPGHLGADERIDPLQAGHLVTGDPRTGRQHRGDHGQAEEPTRVLTSGSPRNVHESLESQIQRVRAL